MTLLNAIPLQMFPNRIKISPIVIPVSIAEYLQIFKKCVSDNNTYIKSGIRRCEMKFYELSRRFNVLCNR